METEKEKAITINEIIEALKFVKTFHNGNYAPQIDEAIRILKQHRYSTKEMLN